MVRWYYPSVFDELEEMRKYMESLSRQMHETSPTALLTGSAVLTTRMLPAQRACLRIDVADTDREVVVRADMIPGVLKKDITLSLKNPQALEISCERNEENHEDNEGYFRRECRFESMIQVVPLPRPVTEDGSRATIRNGVLEVHLKKTGKGLKGKISIE
jgi:HSP20 family protein